jgi:hypothetical protein
MALRALLLSMEKGSAEARGTVEITFNGKTVEKLLLTPENNDLFHQFVLKGFNLSASNDVAIHFAGEGGLAYQVTGQYFVPWTAKPSDEPLSIAWPRAILLQRRPLSRAICRRLPIWLW